MFVWCRLLLAFLTIGVWPILVCAVDSQHCSLFWRYSLPFWRYPFPFWWYTFPFWWCTFPFWRCTSLFWWYTLPFDDTDYRVGFPLLSLTFIFFLSQQPSPKNGKGKVDEAENLPRTLNGHPADRLCLGSFSIAVDVSNEGLSEEIVCYQDDDSSCLDVSLLCCDCGDDVDVMCWWCGYDVGMLWLLLSEDLFLLM